MHPTRLATSAFIVLLAAFAAPHARLDARGAQDAAGQAAGEQATRISPQAMAQIDALVADKQSRTPVQRKIDSRLLHGARIASGRPLPAGTASMRLKLPMTADNRIVLDVRATVTDAVLDRIRGIGAEVTDTHAGYRHIGVRASLDVVEAIAAIPEVTSVAPEHGFMTSRSVAPALREVQGPSLAARIERKTVERADAIASLRAALQRRGGRVAAQGQTAIGNTGSVNSQGDATHRAGEARSTFGVTGSGVKIGVLSDGVDGLAASQASGNLGPVTVLPGAAGSGNEGTAMLEIIADLAPGAQLFFATADFGPAAFAQRIRDLRAAGCDIIVDDIFYFIESPFQDGQSATSPTNGAIIAQAVKDVAASGALYFSSAGNSGRLNAGTSGAWEGDFVDGGAATIGTRGGRIHSFDSSTLNTLTSGTPFGLTLYWSDPLAGSSNDYDLFLLDSAGTAVLDFSTRFQNGTQDPFEFIEGGSAGQRIAIVKFSGAGRFLHLSTNRGRLSIATAGEIHGHAATSEPNSFGVAATPACAPFGPSAAGPCTSSFTSSNQVETFSSDGPRRIFYTSTGAAITPGNVSSTGGQVLAKPDITAADGVSTNVPLFGSFYGTSAAAPHAAAIAALVKSANPALTGPQVSSLLTSTAIDIHTAGWDRDAGFGIIMAFQSVQSAIPPPLAAPTGLTVTRTGPDTATVTWNAVSGATAYTLKFSFAAGAAKTSLGTFTTTSIGLTGLVRGQTHFFVVSASNAGRSSADSAEVLFVIAPADAPQDVDGDRRAELTVWRPSNGSWFWLTSGSGYTASDGRQWGASTDTPLSGDIDGDGLADLVVWRPATGTWFWLTSSSGYSYASSAGKQWGAPTDIPLMADIDGDSKADLIVWRPSDGTWYWLTSSTGYDYASAGGRQWGTQSLGDVPLLGNFDGDRKADLTVWRASTGTWHWLTSSSAYDYVVQGQRQWGNESQGDRPFLGDMDGDGKSDLTVWRANTGTWFWLTSSTAYDYAAAGSKQWGSQSQADVPMLADLDGDARSDLIAWRPGSGTWFWLTSGSVYNYAAGRGQQWGSSGDIPMLR